MRNLGIILILLFTSLLAQAQDMAYAKEIVAQLASAEFYGRGYVAKGDKIAADYISAEFKKAKLKKFKRGYQQDFITSVNSFPGTMELSLNGSPLTAGQDYLIDPGAPGIEGDFSTVTITLKDMFDREVLSSKVAGAQGKFIIIPPYNPKDYSKEDLQQITGVINFFKYHQDNPAAGTILLTHSKLTWSASREQYSKPSFTVKVSEDATKAIESVTAKVDNKFHPKYKTQNVIGYVKGENSDSLIVFTAHYDHLGMMGASARFPGANDNASGIAMLLTMARYYQTHKPKYNTVFMAFGAEELGLLGAKHFVEKPLFDLKSIKFLINFDIAGTGDEGIQVVNGKVYQDKFDQLVKINKENELLAQVKIRGEACNSDHCMFHSKGVPTFYIYTLGGIQAYHDIYDKSETLPLTEFADYFTLLTKFIDQLE